MNDGGGEVIERGDTGLALVVYILFLASFVTVVPWLVAGVMAYIVRSDAPDWQQSHFRFQIRTFWIGVLFAVISGSTVWLLGLGFLLGGLAAVWAIVRCIKGITWLQKGREVPDPASWLFGDRPA